MVVLGAAGRVQYQHVGMDADIEENLPPVIDALLAGKTWPKGHRGVGGEAQGIPAEGCGRRASRQDPTIEIPRAKIAERSEPKTFTLQAAVDRRRCQRAGQHPGRGAAGAAPRMLVIDEWHEIVELGAHGKPGPATRIWCRTSRRSRSCAPRWVETASGCLLLGAIGQPNSTCSTTNGNAFAELSGRGLGPNFRRAAGRSRRQRAAGIERRLLRAGGSPWRVARRQAAVAQPESKMSPTWR